MRHRDVGSVLVLGRSPGEGNGYSHQYFFLENSMEKGAPWATVHGVSKSQTTEQLTHIHTDINTNTAM